jgi:hypothetical protein
MKNYSRDSRFIGAVLLLCLLTHDQIGRAAEPTTEMKNQPILVNDDSESRQDNSKILVEIFLAKDRKGDLEAIKKEFAAFGITKVRPQFFKLGNPPQNIAVGRNVPADVARLAIRLANTYNRGIKFLLAEERLAADYLAIGTSIFDESFQIPIRPEDLEKLSDPNLTTEQYHTLYRHLTGEDKRPPLP